MVKKCPVCERIYPDGTLNYCLEDGERLFPVVEDEPPTAIQIPVSERNNLDHIDVSLAPSEADRTASRPRAKFWIRSIVIGIAAVLLMLAGIWIWSMRFVPATQEPVPIRSIAVLPFQNRSDDPDSDYLSEGLAESLIFRLSQLPGLKVSPTSSVLRYKSGETDVTRAAHDLNVDSIITGRLIKRGDSLNISVELIDTRNNKSLWGEQYERKMSDLLATQREIGQAVYVQLRLKLSDREKTGITKQFTESNEAYQLYLKGRFYWNKRNIEGLKRAAVFFNQAIEDDPAFALAYAGLADSYLLIPVYSAGLPSDYIPKAKSAVNKALELDDSLAEAHTSLAYALLIYDWNFPEAEKEFKRALELSPNYATAHQWYANQLIWASDESDNGLEEMRRALELDPLSPVMNGSLGEAYIYSGRIDDALAQLQKTADMDANYPKTRWDLGTVHFAAGRYKEAVAEYEAARALTSDPWVLGPLGQAFARNRQREEALKILDQLKTTSGERFVSPYDIALVYDGLGDKSEALNWLEKGFDERVHWMLLLNCNPLLSDLRTEERFTSLVHRVGLTRKN